MLNLLTKNTEELVKIVYGKKTKKANTKTSPCKP